MKVKGKCDVCEDICIASELKKHEGRMLCWDCFCQEQDDWTIYMLKKEWEQK